MSRASSSLAAIESRMPRIICAEIAMRPMRSRSSTAIGASRTGGRSTARPGSARRNPFTQSISGNKRMTCRKASAMPIRSIAMISALSPGLARNAPQISLGKTMTSSAHSVRNTTIRTRKIRGELSLNGSMSCAMAMGSTPYLPHNKAGTGRKEEGALPAGCGPQPPAEPRTGSRFSGKSAKASSLRGAGIRGSDPARLFEHLQQLAVDIRVACQDAAGFEHVVAPVEVGREAARLAHQRDPGCHIPGRQVALPIGVETAGRDPGEVERGRSETAHARDLILHRDMLAARQLHVAAAGVRKRAGHDRVGEPLAPRHAQPLIVEERALPAFGGEKLVVGGIVDDARDDAAFALERDRDRKVRNAVQKVQRAIDRIDDPAVGLVAALPRAAFLAEETVARTRQFQLLAQDLLRQPVGGSDKIGRPFERDLQVLDLAEVALEPAARLVRGFDHHVEEGGAKHRCAAAVAVLVRERRSRAIADMRAEVIARKPGSDAGGGRAVGSARWRRSRQERDSRISLMASR